MKQYDPEKTRVEYHPDDTPEYYIPEALCDEILDGLEADARTARDKDTLEFIRKHEASQRSVAERQTERVEQTTLIDRMAKEFLRRHGDWVHVENRLYRKFYEEVQSYYTRRSVTRR
jgi:hypothetical protein